MKKRMTKAVNMAALSKSITDGFELTMALTKLPKSERYGFAYFNREKIADGYELAMVIAELPMIDRYPFLQAVPGKMKTSDHMFLIQAMLQQSKEYALALPDQLTITNPYAIIYAMSLVALVKRLPIAEKHIKNVENGSQLGWVLEMLPIDERFPFALTHLNKVKKGEITSITSRLPLQQRYPYTFKQRDKIINGEQLAHALFWLDDDNLYPFAVIQQDKISNGKELASVLRVLRTLPDKDLSKQLQFALDNAKKIQNAREFKLVLSRLHVKNRRPFEKFYHQNFPSLRTSSSLFSNPPSSSRMPNKHAAPRPRF